MDVRLSRVRDLEAIQAFFKEAVETIGHKPEQVTTDKEPSYPKAIKKVLGSKVKHRTSHYLNNKMEQDSRGIKQRYYPMHNFKNGESAEGFIRAFEEQREHFRFRRRHNYQVSLPLRRVHILGKFELLKEKFLKKKLVWKQSVLPLQL